MRRVPLSVSFGQLVLAILFLMQTWSGGAVAQMATYRFDKDQTSINFSWSHLGLSRQSARLTDVAGRIQFDPATPDLSLIDVTMKAASILTGVPEFDRAIERGPVRHRARRVNGLVRLGVHVAPPSERIEVLERESRGIHHPVAGRARRVAAMLFKPGANGGGFRAFAVLPQ